MAGATIAAAVSAIQIGRLAASWRLNLAVSLRVLPKGMISRLMVRMHRYVQSPELGWVTGVLFERHSEKKEVTNAVGTTSTIDEYTALLAEIPPEGSEIILRARGDQKRICSP